MTKQFALGFRTPDLTDAIEFPILYYLTVVDSLTFTAPATNERLYVALGATFVVLDCTVF